MQNSWYPVEGELVITNFSQFQSKNRTEFLVARVDSSRSPVSTSIWATCSLIPALHYRLANSDATYPINPLTQALLAPNWTHIRAYLSGISGMVENEYISSLLFSKTE